MKTKVTRTFSTDARQDWLMGKIALEIGTDDEGNPSRSIVIRALVYGWVKVNHPEWLEEYQTEQVAP